MSESCNHDCSSCSQSCGEREEESILFQLNEVSKVKKVIGVVSGKGGVGKSMVTSMMAVLMNRRGHTSAILDADITGPSIPKAFGIKGKAVPNEWGLLPAKSKTGIEIMSVNLLLEHDTDPVIWRGPILAGIIQQFWSEVVWGDVDYMFVDMPPGTGDVPLTVFQSLPLDGIIVVTSPQELVSMIVGKAVNMARMMNVPILGLVENYSYVECPDCGKKIYPFGESHIDEVAAKNDLKVLAKLPLNPQIAGASDKGVIELFEGEWLDNAADLVESL